MPNRKPLIPYHVRTCVLLFFTYLCITAIPSYGVPVISTHLTVTKGWDESVLSVISVVTTLTYMLSVPMSLAIRKIGNRRVGLIFMSFNVAAFAVLAVTDLPWYLYLCVFPAFGIATAAAMLVTPGIMNLWFERNKALPMSLVLSAGAVGGFVFPQVAAHTLQVSVRAAWLVFLAIEIFCWLCFFLFVRETPEEVGEIRDGRAWAAAHSVSDTAKSAAQNRCELSLKQCYRSSQFYKLLAQLLGMRALHAGMMSYLIFYGLQRGITSEQAAACLSALSLVGLGGRLFAGSIDRLHLSYRAMNIVSFAGAAGGLFLLSMGTSYPVLLAASGLIGACFGLNFNLFVLLVPKVFGEQNFSVLYGTYNTLAAIGSSLGPVIVYGAAQLFSGYSAAYFCMGVLEALCLLTAITLPVKPATLRKKA